MSKNYFSQGNQLLRNNKLEEAIAAYQKAIEQNPNFYLAYHNLGEALEKAGRLEEALSAYQKAVYWNPEAAWSHLSLGLVLHHLERQKEAEQASQRAVEIEPKLANFYKNKKPIEKYNLPTNKVPKNERNKRILGKSNGTKQTAKREGNTEQINSYVKTTTNEIESTPEWDTRNCLSITSTDQNIPIPNKIYIVPAIMVERNTTRYRANHFAEIIQELTQVEIIDYRKLKKNFFQELKTIRNVVVVIQRLAIHDRESESFMNQLRQTPALIVYDIDDQIFDSLELEDWRVRGLHHQPKQYFHCMKYADQFLVSTKELRKKVEKLFNRPVHVLQNLLNQDLVNLSLSAFNQKKRLKREKFIIGYASGSATHDFDLDVALNALDRFLSEHPNAEFHCIGYVNLPKSFAQKYSNKIVLYKKVHWKELPTILAEFTIQIIPLSNCKFNEYKSQIRYLESSAVGVPVLASNIGEPSQTIVDQYTGYLCENTDNSWYEGLCWYYNYPDKRNYIAQESKASVLNYWTTKSPFQLYKIKNIIQDLNLGLMRDKISIILVAYNPLQDIQAICESIINNTNVPFELLIWINSSDPSVKNHIKNLNLKNSYIVDFGVNVGKSKAANHLFKIAVERFVVGFDDDYIVPQYWAEKMIVAAKSVPKLGWLSTNLTEDSSGIRGLGKVATYSGGISIYLPSGVGGWVVFTTASAREKIGFYREHGLYGGIDGDYNRRARALGLTTGYVRDVVGQHKVQRRNHLAWELFKQRIQDEMRIHGKHSDRVTDKFVDFLREKPKYLNCSIKICTSITHDEKVWGDTHYAAGLKSALEALDYKVRIDKHEEWYNDNADDIVIHLFGLHKYKPNPKHINILWIISHVDLINREFLIGFDYIFCASEKVTKKVSDLVPQIKVQTLPQCTNTGTFYPQDNVQKDLDIVFVGNSRRIYRKAVKYCIENGFDISIWGRKWEQFVDKKYIKGQSLSSNEVANIYRRAKIVLNDHWDDQVEAELVNNRIFDVLACNTLVISDFNAGISKVLENEKLPMFSNSEEFKNLVIFFLENEDRREKLAKSLGESTREHHTFTKRVQAIHESIIYIIENYVNYKSEKLYALRK